MGRGSKGVLIQSTKKDDQKKRYIPDKQNQIFIDGLRDTGKQKVVVMQKDVLNELRQIDPRELANILVGM